ncbi:MAG TPA: DUF4097 family beta strand repeat-containing protein [Acidimicrobiales bacterium]|nr:DUF4097 family beta strand repeat-containing protein [Acidimicrobiales bacterium]
MQTFTTPTKTRVIVTNPVGDVEILAQGSGTTTVDLAPRGQDGEAIEAETVVTCTEANGVSVVSVILPGQRSFVKRRSSLDVLVTAPEGVDVVVSTAGSERSIMSFARGAGQIRLRGTMGDVDIALPSADVSAQSVSGSLGVKTASGDLEVDAVDGPVKVRSVSGDVSIDTLNDDASITLVSGDVSITTAKDHVDLTSVSGDVTITDAHAGASVKSTSGDVTVRRAWSGSVRVATVSGDVVVGIPPGRGVSVDARSMSGDLSSEIDLDGDRGGDAGDGTVVRVTAHSVSGDVEILRAAAATA